MSEAKQDTEAALDLARDIVDASRRRSLLVGPDAAPVLARALLASHAENERMRAVYEAAEQWRRASLKYGRVALDVSIGERVRLIGNRERAEDDLADAVDSAAKANP